MNSDLSAIDTRLSRPKDEHHDGRPPARTHRGGAAAGARPPRVRVLRGTTGHDDPAGRLPVSRATLREAMAALREAGLVETTRGRGGGTVVTLKPRTPTARAAARTSPEKRRDWLDALNFRRIVEPGGADLAARAELSADLRSELEKAHEDAARASKPARHRQADSRLHLTIAALSASPRTIAAVTGCRPRCTRCSWLSRCCRRTSRTRTASTRPSYARSSPASRTALVRRWKNTATTPPRCCAVWWAEPFEQENAWEPETTAT
jgi:DNA-binding GntR family transcriptional regulator